MIVRYFLSWAQTASAAQRAEGAGELARTYLYGDLDATERRQVEIALMSLAEDPSPLVRRALADNFASAVDAPRALIATLACDQSGIAGPVLSRSPLLSDAELIDCVAIGDAVSQTAVALRPRLAHGVCAALAEIGAREACIALAVNPGADLLDFSLRRMVERFGEDGETREALLSRPSLPPSVRSALVAAAASCLSAFAVECGWLSSERAERLLREERDKANVLIVADAAEHDGRRGVRELVAHLRASGQLTSSLVLRALLSGNRDLLESALAELSGLHEDRVAAMLADFRGAGFAAVYMRAGLPEKFLPAFRAALAAQREYGAGGGADARLSLIMVERVITACEAINDGQLDMLMALLRRFEREAALEEARLETARIAQEAMVPEVAPPATFSGVSARAPLIDLVAFEAELMAA
ncbi:MAG: DUF2336 domain-containing protein [Methylocystis sp.]|uniref:DUF2336 domain-containing protein n=1 Tax=Methylocystis sp. TaxID=1911079 RepID=UPI003DA69A5A